MKLKITLIFLFITLFAYSQAELEFIPDTVLIKKTRYFLNYQSPIKERGGKFYYLRQYLDVEHKKKPIEIECRIERVVQKIEQPILT